MARRVGEKLDGVKVVCDFCVATASTPALVIEGAREYVAKKWGWVVTPSGHDLCVVCVNRGEPKALVYSTPKPVPPTPKELVIPEGTFPPKIKRKPRPNKTPPPKTRAKAKKR